MALIAGLYVYGLIVCGFAFYGSDQEHWNRNKLGAWINTIMWPISVPAILLGKALIK